VIRRIREFFSTFLLFYYNQVLGVRAVLASVAIMVALVVDALTDPMVGSFSDNLRSRLGRRHPLMYAASVPLGVFLYLVFSPTVQAAFGNIGAAMRNPEYRFFVVEHFFGMIIAIVLAHVGRVRSKKAKTDAAKFRGAAIFYGLALLIMLAAIPWPGMPAGRPLIRGL